MDNTHPEFAEDVRRWILQAVADGVGHFDELLAHLPGVYPTVVLDALRRLAVDRRISLRRVAAFERDAARAPIPRVVGALPPPHPLEYEWRFDDATAAQLWSTACSLTPRGGRVMLFGTPTVALAALASPKRVPAIFVGEANPITDAVSALAAASRRPMIVDTCQGAVIAAESISTVVIDPPWYPDFVRPMMRLAASICEVGGTILISLPPIGTRPDIIDERRRLLNTFKRLQLQLMSLHTGVLGYETPFFESNALAADGVSGIRSNWRRSDLFVLRKTAPVPTVSFDDLNRIRKWEQFQVGRMRVFLRRPLVAGRRGVPIESVVEGDVFKSVSRRAPERERVAIWTSGNRVFASSHRDLVAIALQMVTVAHNSGDYRHLPPVLRDEVDRLCYFFVRLAALEEAEERDGRPKEDRWLRLISPSTYTLSPTVSRRTTIGARASRKRLRADTR